MKKIVAIFVTLLLLFNTVGMLVFYWGEMEKCEHLALNKIANDKFYDNKLVHFSSEDSNFQLIEDKEILCEGILYDIVKKENKDGVTVYFCFDDTKESGFWNGIAQLGKNSSEQSSAPAKNIAPEVLKYIGQEKSLDHTYIYTENYTQSGFLNKSFFYQNPYGEILAPPPKV